MYLWAFLKETEFVGGWGERVANLLSDIPLESVREAKGTPSYIGDVAIFYFVLPKNSWKYKESSITGLLEIGGTHRTP